MAKVSLFLDRRKNKPSVKLLLNAGNRNAMIATGVVLDCPEQWQPDEPNGPIFGHAMARTYNSKVRSMIHAAQDALAVLVLEHTDINIDILRSAVLKRIDPDRHEREKNKEEEESLKKNSVLTVYRKFLNTKEGRTWEIYETTLRRIREYCEDKKGDGSKEDYARISRGGIGSDKGEQYLQRLQFNEITLDWIDGFERRLSRTMDVNARSIHLRNLRAVCNYAVTYEYTTYYAWRRFTIKKKEGDVHPITDNQFRDLFTFDLTTRTDLQLYRDTALLGFYLIGMNIVDMHALRNCDYRNGYIYYERAKTHRKYCIKVEPEAEAIIEKYRNEDRSPGSKLLDWAARYKTHQSFNQHLNEEGLQRIGPTEREKIEGSYHGRNHIIYHPIVSDMTYYRMRHYWGFTAAKVGISKEVAALCLGHGKKTVTDVYYTFEQDDIDKANRKVIDHTNKLLNK